MLFTVVIRKQLFTPPNVNQTVTEHNNNLRNYNREGLPLLRPNTRLNHVVVHRITLLSVLHRSILWTPPLPPDHRHSVCIIWTCSSSSSSSGRVSSSKDMPPPPPPPWYSPPPPYRNITRYRPHDCQHLEYEHVITHRMIRKTMLHSLRRIISDIVGGYKISPNMVIIKPKPFLLSTEPSFCFFTKQFPSQVRFNHALKIVTMLYGTKGHFHKTW